MAALSPDVLWAQRKDSIYLTIDLKEVSDLKVNLQEDSLSFEGQAQGSLYKLNLEFHAPIKKEGSKWSCKRLIEFYLKKEEEAEWPRITKAKGKFPWIKVDWKRWQDSDDEKEKDDFNLDGLGDFGNFGDMGGPDDFDSDDEDLPDLEPGDDVETAASGTGSAQAADPDGLVSKLD
mmetsp:Transcript_10027/g.22503  ORF Transcript_10027/g.22503 Transcript_10027/m.22503 type:complete len:176 (+) Transcript_10027:133-660(+)|eukprot:CAMPEP_0178408260 /NCGR_PEP_ID=MMETSP0689_2-20121128/19848_1 /TAXON_ID=160604 /ORGANISM="Amphidinium massartii, Strain CS-259" /LENGTH=175 /DNA_ID=CAMNT_0020029351 /DNA_START=98 /DNA_END=625 /DNA_ORIENTATION=+